jgi:glycosyltransferase involved in cell wall biosynthesis
MKILVFSPFYPPHIGGLETHSDEFNCHLSAKGAEITVFTPRLQTDSSEQEVRHTDVRVTRYPALEPFHNYPIPKFWDNNFWHLWHILPNEKYDVIVSRTRFFFPSLMALWYGYRHNTPLLHIEHGSDFAQFNGRCKTTLGKIYDWTIGRFILRHADCIVANSQASARFVAQLSDRSDVSVIYRGANVQTIENCIPNQSILEQYRDKTIIAFIGRLIDGKGTHDLISALSLLQRNDIITFIIGGGPEESRLKKMVEEYHLANQVVFFGNLPFEKAISILKTADIIVNPSYTEGLPTSVTEAALCHKAIIATNVGGTSEVISGNSDGFLIPPRQPRAIAEKLTLLIEDPELRATFAQNAFDGVKNKFTWEISVKIYISILQRLIKKKKDSS